MSCSSGLSPACHWSLPPVTLRAVSFVQHPTWFRYLLAILAVLAATLVRVLLAGWFGDTAPLFTYIVATVVVAWLVGSGPAVVTGVVGFVCAYVFVMGPDLLPSPQDVAIIPLTVAYAFIIGAIIAFALGMRRARDQEAATARTAQLQRQQLHVTLASIGDAVIVTDAQSRITFVNQVAQELTGWQAAEAHGQPLLAVFPIVNEHTRQPVESPVEQALREGRVIGLANHTILLAKDGREIPIDDSAAPIRDQSGAITGVVLVFRDVTARRRAEQEQAKLAAIVASSSDAIISKSLDGIILSWNATAEAMYGYTPDEVLGKPIEILIPPDRPNELRDILARLRRGEPIDNYETVRVAKSGRLLDVSVSVSPLYDEERNVVGASAIVRDITAKKHAERLRDLRLSIAELLAQGSSTNQAIDQFLSTFATAMQFGVATLWLVDEKTHTLSCRHTWHAQGIDAQAFLQASRECRFSRGQGMPGQVWQTRKVCWIDDAATEPTFVRADAARQCNLHSGLIVPLQLQNELLGVIEFFSTSRRAADADLCETAETLTALLGQFLHRRRAEAALLEETHVTETLNKIGGRLVAELDQQNLVELITDETTRLTGAEFGAFFYNSTEQGEAYQLSTISRQWRESFLSLSMPRNTALFAPTFRGERVVRYDDVTQAPDYGKNSPHNGYPAGHVPVRSYLAAPVTSRTGNVIGGLFFGHREVGVFTPRDEQLIEGIAAQAAIAMDNARLYRELQQADQRKDEFLAMLAHELRNPLAPVRNAVEILRLAPHDVQAVESARSILERQVEHLVRLVDDLLDVSRIMRGKIELRKERVELSAVVDRAVEITSPFMNSRNHRLTVDRGRAPLWIEADPVRLAQVIGNLLNNAAKYTEPGGHIDLSLQAQGDMAVVRVRDNGLGIPADLLPHVFDLFVQADHSTNRSHDGLGIGLTLVRSLVEMHGGHVSASSAGRMQGSDFTIHLPLLNPVAAIDNPPQLDLDGAPPPHRTSGYHILVADDNVDSANTMAMLLRLHGHEVKTVHDGQAALDAALAAPPDVALLDIGMPHVDGYEVARRMRQESRLNGLKLIALTGWGKDEDRQLSKSAGFDHHLVKPVDFDQLQSILDARPDASPQHDHSATAAD